MAWPQVISQTSCLGSHYMELPPLSVILRVAGLPIARRLSSPRRRCCGWCACVCTPSRPVGSPGPTGGLGLPPSRRALGGQPVVELIRHELQPYQPRAKTAARSRSGSVFGPGIRVQASARCRPPTWRSCPFPASGPASWDRHTPPPGSGRTGSSSRR